MIQVQQRLYEKDYRSAFTCWYNSFQVAKLDKVIGVLLIFFSAITFFIAQILPVLLAGLERRYGNTFGLAFPIIGVVYGFYLLYIKRFVAIRSMVSSAMTSKDSKETSLDQIDIKQNGEIITVGGAAQSRLSINAFVGYTTYPGYLALFLARNNLLLLKSDAFVTGSADELIELLKGFDVPLVKNPKKDIKGTHGSTA